MRIGLDVGPYGRTYRGVAGVITLTVGIVTLLTEDALGLPLVLRTLAYVAVLTAFYLGLHGLLGERVLARVDPFVATVLVLGPLAAFSALPHPWHIAVELYVGASLLLTASISYGGCEVIALPTLLFRRRYVVYCSINVLDAAERPLRRAGDPLLRAAAVVAGVVGGYFLVVHRILDKVFEVEDPVSQRWALLLLAPAAVLADRAWRSRADQLRSFMFALGAAALLGGALTLSGLVPKSVVFGVAVAAGLLLAGYRAIVTRRRKPAPSAEPAAD